MLCVVIRAAERAAEWSCAVKCGHSREILFRTGFCLDTGKPQLGGGRQEGAGRGELRQWSLRCSPLYLIKYLSLSLSLSLFPASLFPGSGVAGLGAVHTAAPALCQVPTRYLHYTIHTPGQVERRYSRYWNTYNIAFIHHPGYALLYYIYNYNFKLIQKSSVPTTQYLH